MTVAQRIEEKRLVEHHHLNDNHGIPWGFDGVYCGHGRDACDYYVKTPYNDLVVVTDYAEVFTHRPRVDQGVPPAWPPPRRSAWESGLRPVETHCRIASMHDASSETRTR
jgi:hypothetical protein